MFDRTRLTRYLRDFQEISLPEIVTRELELPATQRILSIYGPRRSGKSYYFKQLVRDLHASGVKKENVVYLNFEDTRLAGLDFKELEDIIRLHLELYPSAIGRDLHVLLDEPQTIPQWERAVRSMHDSGRLKLYVTGSSARMLSWEIATSLRGRTLSYLFLPYSFRELVTLRGIRLKDFPDFSTNEEARVKSLLSEYLRIGGYPEVVAEPDEGTRSRILREYLDLIIYRDIIERYSLENLAFVKFLLNRLFACFSRQVSAHKIFNTAKSQGIRVSKTTVYDCISYAEDALAVFLLRKWSPSETRRQMSFPKAYLADTGFAKLFSSASDDAGYLAENAVFLDLKRAQNSDPHLEIYYWRGSGDAEVDFAIMKSQKFIRLIQVCRSIDDPDTLKREIRALVAASRQLHCRHLTILNWDLEVVRNVDGLNVEFRPLWKWILAPLKTKV